MPYGSVLEQCIDDLMVASKTKEACKFDSIALLNHLAENGHKVSPTSETDKRLEAVTVGKLGECES